ncbi:MAG: glucose-6-phosphate dehydrogenase, partial [Chloroflexota bacterium]
DHYLAKETVQNLMVFRFANTIFEPIWNRNYIDFVQITAAETVDVGHRAGYYDTSGVLRDMFQNHLLQLLSLVAMEPPTSFEADSVRDEKVKVLRAIRPIGEDELRKHTVLARYEGYLSAEGVAEGSTTPTYAAIQLYIDNWRWQGVPFYLRSGKALANKATEIVIQFKRPPHLMFPSKEDDPLTANSLAICIQPHEGFHLQFEVKVPDTTAEMRSYDMEFHYDEAFEDGLIPEAYERLLLEAIEGDATLFTRSDGIEAAWTFVDSILKGYAGPKSPKLAIYEKGSWGPEKSDQMLSDSGHQWLYGCADH